MELIAAILLAGPIGYLLTDRRKAMAVYLGAWAAIFPIQTVVVTNEGNLDPSYWVINAMILCLGLTANHFGARVRRARRRRHAA